MDNNKTCCKQLLHILPWTADMVPGSPSSIDKAFGIEHLHLSYYFLCLCLYAHRKKNDNTLGNKCKIALDKLDKLQWKTSASCNLRNQIYVFAYL